MLFSRRAIQQILDENASWIPPKSLRKQIRKLNNPDEASPLATVWEVAVLNGLSKIVTIVHEPDLGCQPDVVFQMDGETVIADITAISDRSRHHANPVDDLNDEFLCRVFPLIQAGLRGGFMLSVGEIPQEGFGREKFAPKLRIPRVNQFEAVLFTPAFDDFMTAIKRAPKESRTFRIDSPDCDLTFSFYPNSSGWTLNKVRYTQATMLKRNPLWNNLCDKAKQLEKVQLSGHRGIIACDGDCDVIKENGAWDKYGADDIVKEFLRVHNTIEFVLTLVPTHKLPRLDLSPKNHTLVFKLYFRDGVTPWWLFPIREFPSRLPQVRNTGMNARYEAEWKRANKKWHVSPSFRGACTVSDTRIKLSARDLLELLSGVLRQDALEALPFMAGRNPFLNKLMRGQLITAMRIEKGEASADDDWVVFEFGNPDPAVSPFRVKETPQDGGLCSPPGGVARLEP